MKIVCAWCGAVLGEKPGIGITHGVCPACAKAIQDEENLMDALPSSTPKDSSFNEKPQPLGLKWWAH